MKYYTQILILILALKTIESSCFTWNCQTIDDLCFDDRCGFKNYSNNRIMFINFFKENINDDDYVVEADEDNIDILRKNQDTKVYSLFKKAILDMKDVLGRKSGSYDNNTSSSYSVSTSREYSSLTTSSRVNGRPWHSKKKEFFANHGSVDELPSASNNYRGSTIYSKSIYGKDAFDSDTTAEENAKNFKVFVNNKNDVDIVKFFYPEQCLQACRNNYRIKYILWSHITDKLYNFTNNYISRSNDCRNTKRAAREYVDELCNLYVSNSEVREEFLEYYDSTVDSNLCDLI